MLNLMAVSGTSDGDGPQLGISQALEAIRTHLGMEVAYVSEFVDGRAVFRNVDAPGLEALIKPGDSQSLDDVYCRHILAGTLPELMPNTADHPLAQTLPITHSVPIGAHMSVPVRLADGRAYGMFCCLSPRADKSLNHRDLQVMKLFAGVAAHQIGRDVEEIRAIRDIRSEIDGVIADQSFSVVYQPIFSIDPFRITGFEALCRFATVPQRSPDMWFKQADRAGYGVRLELTVLRHALRALQVLPEDKFLSVNASPATILSGELGRILHGIPKGRVVLEVTEHAKVEDYAALHAALTDLRKAGVRLAVDDAGAGYSSFQHIIQLSPDIIKLDMSLTRSVDKDAGRRALAAALGYFARETGCQMVAEGIETDMELLTLKTLGVAKGQGYLLGRPTDLQTARGLVAAPEFAIPE